ncbi:MAG TPA: xylose isomerase, partial [Treponemataceae bacterium]|nr:xylose isomerase [Treponemataceae bacterium]
LAVLRMGGFKTGGLNFDAKIRRNSTDPADLFIAHIGGMDVFAYGLEKAQAILDDGRLVKMVKDRYASFDSGNGKKFADGQMKLEELAALATSYGKIGLTSGKQELYENIFNEIVMGR